MKIATECFIESDGRYLMLHRVKKKNDMHEGRWIGVGGKMEPGESPEDCVCREVFEETGLCIRSPRLHGILTFPAGSVGDDDWYVFLYTATDFSGDLKECDEGELAWVEIERLQELNLHKGDLHFLSLLRSHDGVFSAKYTYRDGELLPPQIHLY